MGIQISCDCGTFKALLPSFPASTPGRLACYCRDCQSFLEKIDRRDVLDSFGGTQIIPVYPCDIEFLMGVDNLKCNKLTERGLHRWTASCCNSPIANTKAGLPWVGLFHTAYKAIDNAALDSLGDVKSRIFGRSALAGAPYKMSDKIGIRDMAIVLPFIIKGKLLQKHRKSPFFKSDNITPISTATLLGG